MSELKRYGYIVGFEDIDEIADGEYYLADDVDKRIEELEQHINLLDKLLLDKCTESQQLNQRNKDLERALRMSTCKFDTDNDGNCHLCVGKGCFIERLLKGGE